MKPYQESIVAIERRFNTSLKRGLTEQEVERRLREHGNNTLPDIESKHALVIFLEQFLNPLVYILIAAAVLIGFIGDFTLDAFIISGVLIFNAIIGTIQEIRTRKAIKGLKQFDKTTCIVLRDGSKTIVDDSDLVTGDIIFLQEGQRVPADARITLSHGLRVDEAALTGETGSVSKSGDAIEEEVAIADRGNMVHSGTYILAGSGQAIVVATGLRTEIGKIHQAIFRFDTEVPLKKEVDYLVKVILLFTAGTCIFLLSYGLLIGKQLQEMLVMLTALFICVVPEGLPVVLTLVLVTGAYKMAQQRVLMRNLQAIEVFGRINVIVTDKTGTLTRNEMVVSAVYADDVLYTVSGCGYFEEGKIFLQDKEINISPESKLYRLGIATSLLNNTEITYLSRKKMFDIKGSQTEASLYILSQKLGINRFELDKRYKKIFEIPFSAELAYHALFCEHEGTFEVFLSGAPDAIFPRIAGIQDADREALSHLLGKGLRVIAVAYKIFPQNPFAEGSVPTNEMLDAAIKDDLILLGICGIQDDIRSEVADIIKQARDAEIKVVMATGDHQKTALYVAKQVGIYQEGDRIIDGIQFDVLSDEELLANIEKITVFSRVSPENKTRIVRLYQQKHQLVAMTGDGINDAPSLVAADLGIAMGNIGTEVAKQAADAVLLDDRFESIMRAIAHGRHLFQTLRRVFLYFFATNTGEVLIILLALIMHLPLPLTAAQILWLNLVTDGFLDVSLSMEPQDPHVLREKQLRKKPNLVDLNLFYKTLFMAIPMGIISLFVFYQYYLIDLTHARTMTLITMAMLQWFNAWNCRSESKSLLKIGLFSNRWLIAATAFVLFLQFLILYTPFMRYIFRTVPLSANDWMVVLCASAPIILLEELRKWYMSSPVSR